MKKTLAVILFLMFVPATCFACQPTPTEPVVIQKGTTDYSSVPASAISDSDQTNDEPFPSSWEHSQENSDGTISIRVSAPLETHDLTTWPVYTAQLISFSQEQVNSLVEAFFDDAQLYQGVSVAVPQSKGQLEEKYLELQNELELRKDPEYTSQYDESDEDLRAELENLEDLIADAPETVDADDYLVRADTELTYDNDYQAYCLFVNADLGRTNHAFLDVRSSDNLPFTESSIVFNNRVLEATYISYPETLTEADATIPLENALSQAETLLSQIGVSGYACVAQEVGATGLPLGEETSENIAAADKCWILHFSKQYDGHPSTYTDTLMYSAGKDAESPIGHYDYIEIIVDDDGIAYFEWRGNEESTTVLNEGPALLGFDEISQAFLAGITQRYSNKSLGLYYNIYVTDIQLGYMRIKNGNGADDFLLVPVWDFFGVVKKNETKTTTGSYDPGDLESYTSLLTINAIDGSIIDRSIGY